MKKGRRVDERAVGKESGTVQTLIQADSKGCFQIGLLPRKTDRSEKASVYTSTMAADCCTLLLFSAAVFTVGFSQTVHKMAIQSDIRFRFATTEVMCLMSNDETTARELTFQVTLPKEGFIANFTMEIEGVVYPGEVKEKAKAREQYLVARQSGHTGGLVEQSARHSNKFDVSVNIKAGSNVTFSLLYQELLRRRFGVYEHSVFINPSLNPKEFSVEAYIQERTDITDVRTPAMRKDIINNALEEEVNTMTQISQPSASTAHVVYRPSPEDLKEGGAGWFVVQYDVDMTEAGELLVVDGYFVHFFSPPDDLPPLPLDIVFVLDISGSMSGRKMQQQKDAMGIILDDLKETDRFNIVLFDGEIQIWQTETNLIDAHPDSVDLAQKFVADIGSRGSTNIHTALMRGLDLLTGSREAARVPMLFFLTDGEATAGVRDSAKIVADVTKRNEGVVNVYSLAFGDGADYSLLRQISAKNKGFARKIYEAADASEQVSGLYREIATVALRALEVTYHSTSNNDTGDDDDITVPVPIIGVELPTVTTCYFATLYGRSDFVVAGKLKDAEVLMRRGREGVAGLKIAVKGMSASGEVSYELETDDVSSLTLGGGESPPFWAGDRDLSDITERAWAFLTIKQLLKEKVAAAEEKDLVKNLDRQILELSLKYHFVTPLTSMVVTRPEDDVGNKTASEASVVDSDDVKSTPRSSFSQRMTATRQRQRRPQSAHIVVPSYAQKLNANGPVFDSHDMMGFPGLPGLNPQHGMIMPTQTQMPWTKPITRVPKVAGSSGKERGKSRGKGKADKGKGKGKNRKNKKGNKKNGKNKKKKQCVPNKKVILRALTTQGTQTERSCYALKGGRDAGNFTVLADPSSDFALTLGLMQKRVTSLQLRQASRVMSVRVNETGDLVVSDLDGPQGFSPPGGANVTLSLGHYDVTVTVTAKKCKAVLISVDVMVRDVDAEADVVKQFGGFAAKAFQLDMGGMSKKKNPKRKNKRKSPKPVKSCVAVGSPAERSHYIKGKMLNRYSA